MCIAAGQGSVGSVGRSHGGLVMQGQGQGGMYRRRAQLAMSSQGYGFVDLHSL